MAVSKIHLPILLSLLSPWVMADERAIEVWKQSYEAGTWNLSTSPFKCSLSQQLSTIGKVQFERKPEGNTKVALQLNAAEAKITDASVTLLNPDWQAAASQPAIYRSQDPVEHSQVIFPNIGDEVLNAVARGAWLDFRLSLNERPQSLVFTNNQGQAAVQKYRECVRQMAPLMWDTARETLLYFGANTQVNRPEDRQKLKDLVGYMNFDPKVTKVLVDGHSENLGNNMANRAISQQIADDVASRLVETGLKRSQLEVRVHGNRYPAYKNTSDDGQLNRRVTIRLIRKPTNKGQS